MEAWDFFLEIGYLLIAKSQLSLGEREREKKIKNQKSRQCISKIGESLI